MHVQNSRVLYYEESITSLSIVEHQKSMQFEEKFAGCLYLMIRRKQTIICDNDNRQSDYKH